MSGVGGSGSGAVGAGGARQKPAVRRASIVEAARGVILREGLGGTRLRDIAGEAGVSVGTVTYHFESVAEILNEVVVLETARFYSSIIEAVDAEPDPVAGVRMLVEPLFAATDASDEHWRLWSDYWTAVARKPAVAAEYVERIRVWEACLTRTLRRGAETGAFPALVPRAGAGAAGTDGAGAAGPAGADRASEVALKLAAYSDGVATQLAQKAPGLTSELALTWMWTFLGHETGASFA
ncbi:TetR family transcriptional regulator C-terminal domain-containing protein [Frigoribacterium sp. PvP032]|uniref:TetR family transcriptional regulator C-terminal domain-containing protein n=1 Tax=Frigoribacterium sp. PvP032 TaxID=2806589 RepID=UPI001B7276B0|nr:TetR family transcriptional regulator C-terminal domain-containing protein [Frigoribacterium sp. PvP032]MBP1191086.1 AcrR family transcriptional regulator [Frigoribacterium sp. PvP032]